MKKTITTLLCAVIPVTAAFGEPVATAPPKPAAKEDVASKLKKHDEGAKKLGNEQDELSADVQDLNEEQSDPKVKKLLKEVEVIMADATDRLETSKTDGTTIAIQTEVIEKIFEAAKKKQQKGGG
ncbi:MAG: hypothetical protein AB8F34_00215 [Akkermansiaceae bacterium]